MLSVRQQTNLRLDSVGRPPSNGNMHYSQVLHAGALPQVDAVCDILTRHEARHQMVHVAGLTRVRTEGESIETARFPEPVECIAVWVEREPTREEEEGVT